MHEALQEENRTAMRYRSHKRHFFLRSEIHVRGQVLGKILFAICPFLRQYYLQFHLLSLTHWFCHWQIVDWLILERLAASQFSRFSAIKMTFYLSGHIYFKRKKQKKIPCESQHWTLLKQEACGESVGMPAFSKRKNTKKETMIWLVMDLYFMQCICNHVVESYGNLGLLFKFCASGLSLSLSPSFF